MVTNMKLLEILQTVSPVKARLIDRIREIHPGAGVDKGWSWYVGGMRDTGDWNLDDLIKVPDAELIQFIKEDDLAIEKRNAEKLRVSKLSVGELEKERVNNMTTERRIWEEIIEKRDSILMWGKPNP